MIEADDCYYAHVEEGLGTKNIVAEAMQKLTGRLYFDKIAQDGVAMIINDMITLGALPISLEMHLAVGDSNWFNDTARSQNLIEGWKRACNLARCAWGGGETPTLKDIVNPETILLSGSALGIIKPKDKIIKGNIQAGDAIIIFKSSGIHANGITLARKIADKLPAGYLTSLDEGNLTFGEAILEPTIIYVPIIEDCQKAGINIHYAANITGHGWRKLMRANEPFIYVIESIPTPQPIFEFLQKHGPINDEEAYSNLNMGAGFVLYVAEKDVAAVLSIAEKNNLIAIKAGYIEKQGSEKKVIIKPKGLTLGGDTLKVR
ncbi:MAG: AIR synthase-related protein [Candidatus Parcubacteria bacterium]|nr:AIR synthase-related protein [Candidatus Parcubacteria bacterium]